LAFQPKDVDKFGDFRYLEIKYLVAMKAITGAARCGTTIFNCCDELQAIYDLSYASMMIKGYLVNKVQGLK